MQIFEGYAGMYEFNILPEFAKYILEQRLGDYVKESLLLSRKMKLPVLQHLNHWDDEQLIEYSKTASAEYLTYIVENRSKQEIENSLSKWLKDQLQIVGKYDILSEDIMLITYIRSHSLKKFIGDFTTDIQKALRLVEELDLFNLGENLSATNTYIRVLKDKIDESDHFTNKLVNTLTGMVYVFDLVNKKIIYSNQKAGPMLGYSEEEMRQLSPDFIGSITHPDDLPVVLQRFQCFDTLKDEEVCSFEHRLRDNKGHYHWMRNYETVFKRNEQGRPEQIIGAAYDVSKEKTIAEDLQHREKQLSEAQSLARLGSFEWDIKNGHTENSDQFYKIFEYTGKMPFEHFITQVHPVDKEKLKAAFERAFVSGNYECEYRYMVNDREKYVWSKGVVLFENGQPSKMTGTVQDITVRRKIEEALLQKAIELEKSNADLVEFTHVASHDLKEPLRKIATYADVILAKELHSLTPSAQTYFTKIIDSSRRMQQMIDDILALSSVSSGSTKEDCSLQSILDDALLMLEHAIQEKKATVTSDDLPAVCVEPALFRQLFLNLISNALKFSKKEVLPVIQITHSFLDRHKIVTGEMGKAHYVAIKVQDNGIGFSNEFSDKIFSLFQRLHGKKDYEGNGLGLSICKKIVEEHNGTITAHSEPGRGSVFTITIPVHQ